MGIISKALAEEISRKFTSKNFGQKEQALMDKIKEVLVEQTKAHMGKELWDAFTKEPKFFKSMTSVYISPNDTNYQKFFPEGNQTYEVHPYINFDFKIPSWNTWDEDVVGRIEPNSAAGNLFTELFKLEIEIRDFRKKVKCLIETTLRTTNTLKNEFPEAYFVYLEIMNTEKEVLVMSSPCDTVEALRSQLKTNQNVDKEV